MRNPNNSALMKFKNRHDILNRVQKSPISRANLARETGLSKAAITKIIDDLLEKEILSESGTSKAKNGRKPILLDINPDFMYILGLDISRTNYTIGLLDMKGNVIDKCEIAPSKLANPFDELDNIAKEIRRIIVANCVPSEKILGLGVCTPGPLDFKNGIILNPPGFDMWRGIHIVEILKGELKLEIFLENNSVALALAEKYFGIGKKYHSYMLLVIDTGIGAGIIIDDSLYRGSGGLGGEVGHSSIDINGKPCSCGNRGCLEVYASIPAILEEAYEFDKGIIKWEIIVDRANLGDSFCSQLLEKEAYYLAGGIINAMNILELEAVVLTGFILYKPEQLIKKINEIVSKRSITRDVRKETILVSSISKDSKLISSATIIIDKFINGTLLPASWNR